MSESTSWNRRQVLSTIVIAALVTLVLVQAYSLVVILPTRTASGATGTAVTTSTNTITVQGTGHASVKPDTATLSIGVQTQGSTAQAAIQANSNTMNQVVIALNGIGIDNSNIQTTYYNVSPVYSPYSPTTPQTIIGYQALNQIQVTILASGQTLSEFGTKIGQVIDTAVGAGANQLNGVQFSASQALLSQAEQSALADASKDASLQAHTIASVLGVNITGLVSATTINSNYYPGPIYAASLSSAGTPIVAPNSLTVSASVQAVFSIG